MTDQTTYRQQYLSTRPNNVRPTWAFRFSRTVGTSLLYVSTFFKWYMLLTFVVYVICTSMGIAETASLIIGGVLGVGSEFFRRPVRESLLDSPYRLRDMDYEEAKQIRWTRCEWRFFISLVVVAAIAGFLSVPQERGGVACFAAVLAMAVAAFLLGLLRLLLHFVREFRDRMDTQ